MSALLKRDLDLATKELPPVYNVMCTNKLQEMEDMGLDRETIEKAAKVFAPELDDMYAKKLQEMENTGIDQVTINMARKEFERIEDTVGQ